jgi:hypothetical protein
MLKSPKRQPSTHLYPANELRGYKEMAGLRVEDLAKHVARDKGTVEEVLLGQDTRLSTLVAVAAACGAKVKISFERQ